MLTAVRYLGRVGLGVTTPQLFRADDGRVYVVKLKNNRLGTKVLVSELLAAKFGEVMGLRFPPGGIIAIDRELIAKTPRLQEIGVEPGRHFASLFLNRCQYLGRRNISKAANIGEMAGIILFDHLFHNADRNTNGNNLLLRREPGGHRIYAIDNSHLFRSGRWTPASLAKLGEQVTAYYRFTYGRILKDYLSPADFSPYAEKVAALSDSQVAGLIGDIPAEWLADEAERAPLAAFISQRRQRLGEILEELRKHIPMARGGRQWWGGKK